MSLAPPVRGRFERRVLIEKTDSGYYYDPRGFPQEEEWQEEEFKQICSRESLTEKAANLEKTIVVKEHERARYDFDPTMFYENRFWNRRPDGIVINKHHRTLYILEFKRSSDRNKDFLRVKEDEANELISVR